MAHNRLPIGMLGLFAVALALSAIRPHDIFTWMLEVMPAVLGAIVLIASYPRFRLTAFVYGLLLVHALILVVGGHYTYAEVPLFNWIRDEWGLARNYYDRVGHFAQGFIPAILVRELLLRQTPLRPGGWLTTLVISVCLAISAAYELIEFAVAKWTGTAADAFLGTQGDVWDTQWDMLLALIGAICSLLVLSKLHDKALRRL